MSNKKSPVSAEKMSQINSSGSSHHNLEILFGSDRHQADGNHKHNKKVLDAAKKDLTKDFDAADHKAATGGSKASVK